MTFLFFKAFSTYSRCATWVNTKILGLLLIGGLSVMSVEAGLGKLFLAPLISANRSGFKREPIKNLDDMTVGDYARDRRSEKDCCTCALKSAQCAAASSVVACGCLLAGRCGLAGSPERFVEPAMNVAGAACASSLFGCGFSRYAKSSADDMKQKYPKLRARFKRVDVKVF
jgi:hypothetical protein